MDVHVYPLLRRRPEPLRVAVVADVAVAAAVAVTTAVVVTVDVADAFVASVCAAVSAVADHVWAVAKWAGCTAQRR